MVFNGEIYNYKLLRFELEAAGHVFATQTDTEVIVHGYEAWGIDVIERLRGMFAIGIWDEPNDRLLLARDRLGKKPLYYTQVADDFLFASEIKALFEFPGLRREVNADILPFHLVLGYTPAPSTMFGGINKLAPGELLILEHGRVTKRRYWQPVMDTRTSLSFEESVQQLREVLSQAVEMRLMSDVPIGAFLSGGLDSTAVVALMSRALGHPVNTFTVGFDFGNDPHANAKFNVDQSFANLAARYLGTRHHSMTIRVGPDLAELLPHLIWSMDEPVAQPTIIQTACGAALARVKRVPVLLTGDAADELFAGYPAYQADRVLERYLRLPAVLRRTLLSPLLTRLPARCDRAHKLDQKSRITHPVKRYLSWMNLIDIDRLSSLLDKELADPLKVIGSVIHPLLDSPETVYFADRIAFASLNLWIAEESNMRIDKMSMAMSVEARAPFQDHKLVELALRIPLQYKLRGSDSKAVLKAAVADLVPPEILRRPKWGFLPPVSNWLRTVFRPLVDTYLAPDRVAATGFFRPEAVSQLVAAHMTKEKYELWPIWSLLVFHMWYAIYIDSSLTLPGTLTAQDLISSALVNRGTDLFQC